MSTLDTVLPVAITHCQPADISSDYLNVSAPSPVACNPCLLGYSRELIFHHFPQANPTAVNMQHSQIAARLSVLYQQKQEHYQEAKIAKEVEKQVSVSKWLGIVKCNTLCQLSQVSSETNLPSIWCDFAKAKSEDRLVSSRVGSSQSSGK